MLRRAARAFIGSANGVLGLIATLIILAMALLAPVFLGDAATTTDFGQAGQSPAWPHVLGTDRFGRDILARTLVATRLSLGMVVAATGLSVIIGLIGGTLAALSPPLIRKAALRVIEIAIAFPTLIVAMFIVAILGPGIISTVVGLALAMAASKARLAMNLTLGLRERDFIQAAMVVGVPKRRLVTRYILPNLAEPLVVSVGVSLTTALMTVAALGFLGLGSQPPEFEWGRLLAEGLDSVYLAPLEAITPAVAIIFTAIAAGFVTEGLVRALNPTLWGQGAPPIDAEGPAGRGQPDGRPHESVIQAADPGALIEVKDLRVAFDGPSGERVAVAGISFSVAEGEVVGIVGESGSGKSLTALAISRLLPPAATATGSVVLDGRDVLADDRNLDRFMATRVALAFQNSSSSFTPSVRLGTQMTESARIHRGLGNEQARETAVARLVDVHMPAAQERLDQYPHELSGGMRQRVMIAMGLMNEPRLLIADEPTTALDVTVQAQLMRVLADIRAARDLAMIFISHDLALVSQVCDRVVVMYAGSVVEDLTVEQLIQEPRHPYTRALLSAVPKGTTSRESDLAEIPGSVPLLGTVPTGCAFHPRCPLAEARCVQERPPAATDADGRRNACWVTNEELSRHGQVVS